VVERRDAEYPSQELTSGKHADVILAATVNREGRVAEISVLESGGDAFDAAAREAVLAWTFVPAKRNGNPVVAKIRVRVHFAPPEPLLDGTSHSHSHTHGHPAASQAAEAPAPVTPAVTASAPEAPTEVLVLGRSHVPSRGAGDYEIAIGKLAHVPRADSASLLRLAPGVLLTNAGGVGHPYQIFLRGFDAREGQDIEFTVDGVPVNEVGNPHGNGLADTHFIIPELVQNLRVVEGPFAPQQGNFAVAGSALYDLGLSKPGLTLQGTYGSFNSKRLLAMYAPDGMSDHTFGAAEVFSTDGFGSNRSAQRATAMGGYETALGANGSLRVLATSYAAHYKQAGVVREDDVQRGRLGFYDTYDTTQGGDSARHSLAATLEGRLGGARVVQALFLIYRDFRLRQNLTGFQQDPQQTWQSEHTQRGDLIDQRSHTLTVGARGSGARQWQAWGRRQELELGYFARYDSVDAVQQRNRSGTTIPYRTDLNLTSGLSNIGLYGDASLRPTGWLSLRGGVRADVYSYSVTNHCAVSTQTSFGGDPLDTECFSSDRQGYRSPDQSSATAASLLQPRVSLILGAFSGFSFSLSHGLGSRSLDPQYVNQDLKTPFARVTASEFGVSYHRAFDRLDLSARSVFFRTHVNRDLFFNETEGRNTLAGGTTRTGWAGNARVTGNFFDLAANLTLVRASFDDTHLAVPYAPGLVARMDGALFGELPFALAERRVYASLGAGLSYVGKRPLPYDELSQTTLLLDLGASLKWRSWAIGLTTTNLLGRKYRLSEYNYASDFRSQSYPTLVSARHFTAGEPRAIYLNLGLTLDGDAQP